MNSDSAFVKILSTVSLLLWAIIIVVPLFVLLICALNPEAASQINQSIYASLFRSFAFSGIIAGVSVLLGWIPGRLLGTSRSYKDILLLLILLPLVLPRYVLFYAWWLLLSPTTTLGAYLSSRTEIARFVGNFSSISVLIMWYWPLAAMILGQGWRNIDRQIWDSASLDVSGLGFFRNVTWPLLKRPILLAFGVCFVLSLSEFATFHLAGIDTIGTELAVLYEQTGSKAALARASWPVAIAAFVLAIILGKSSESWVLSTAAIGTVEFKSQKSRWFILTFLIGISLLIPIVLLISNVSDIQPFVQFLTLHFDELGWSLVIAVTAAGLAYLIAFGVLSLDKIAKFRGSNLFRFLSLIMRSSIFLVMFLPASIVAISILEILAVCNLSESIQQGWYIVSIGLAGRFAGLALILLLLTRYAQGHILSEMALADGASRLQIFRHIHLPNIWPIIVGGFILIVMFCVTELSATIVLLPAGLPNFAQRLLNQMHYARDQQVIASCLILICFFLMMTFFVVLLLRLVRLRRLAFLLLFCFCLNCITGCKDKSSLIGKPEILGDFGISGHGQGEFVYPRAIDIAGDGSVYIIDKTGRIQQFSPEGDFTNLFKMPVIDSGKPTGISFGPDGNLYVADTHYYRVMVFSPNGDIIRQWGKFGTEDGCFIYPTDIAFSGDGRIFVSEYGGNDRISVFNEQGEFLYTFGSSGSDSGQFSRPSSLCVDEYRKRLYVADACNHRIAIYDFDGVLIDYIGSVGISAGQLRYPYDLDIFEDGTIVVCEYGNNRIQLFSPEGQTLGVYGKAGRQLGELAYPWGLAIDSRSHVFVVDAGNNRIQVWQL